MKRIGVAASKIAKDNLVLYNFYVLVLSSLFSLMIFLLSGFSVIVGLAIISYITKGFVTFEYGSSLWGILNLCMITLAIVVGIINLVAILMNIKFKK